MPDSGLMEYAPTDTVGAWLSDIDDQANTVRSLVPGGYDAYAVLPNPAYRNVPSGASPSLFAPSYWAANDAGVFSRRYHSEATWSDVALANRRIPHPTMTWASITGAHFYEWDGMQPGVWDLRPARGSLPLRQTILLCQALAVCDPAAATYFFGVSELSGDLSSMVQAAPLSSTGHRLFEGPLQALPSMSFTTAGASFRAPNVWWPDTRTWCVVSDYDLLQTYVGADARTIAHLLLAPGFEAFPLRPDQPLLDHVNPTPRRDPPA